VVIEGMFTLSKASFEGILKALPVSDSSDYFFTELMVKECQSSEVDFVPLLNRMSSPEVRLRALSQIKKNSRNYNGEISETQYQAWGVTRQQFEAILSPPEERRR
jgi:hypothetical protein